MSRSKSWTSFGKRWGVSGGFKEDLFSAYKLGQVHAQSHEVLGNTALNDYFIIY